MKKTETTEDLPDDPFKMPPPYWRSSDIIFQLTDSLEELCTSLRLLHEVLPIVNHQLCEYFDRNPEPNEEDDDDLDEFGEITEPLWDVEKKISSKCNLAIFMSAIVAEDLLNKVCVYNLHKDISDSIEKLNPPEKLLIVSASLTNNYTKGEKPYESLRTLTSWRNSYAHGHCVDRPTKSLRHNHLISPKFYHSIPLSINDMIQKINGYLIVSDYLRSISVNEYTSGSSYHDQEIRDYLSQLEKYKFVYEDNGVVYDLRYNE